MAADEFQVRRALEAGADVFEIRLDVPEREGHGVDLTVVPGLFPAFLGPSCARRRELHGETPMSERRPADIVEP